MITGDNYILYHGDCLDILPTLEAASIDAVIVDPPYGTTACRWDSVIPFEPMWAGIKHVLKARGACVLFGSEPFSSMLRVSNLAWYKYDWVWEKEQGSNHLNAPFRPIIVHENIMIFSLAASTYAPTTMIYNPQKRSGKPYKGESKKTMGLMVFHSSNHFSYKNRGARYPKSVIKQKTERGLHPTQKPVPLFEYLIKTYTNEGDTILDFTMGSGTTGVAAMKTGRKFIGIELDKEYFDIAHARIANMDGEFMLMPNQRESNQMTLFENGSKFVDPIIELKQQ
jgi:site-specific DNA-methyltransferase (adenine-specific)